MKRTKQKDILELLAAARGNMREDTPMPRPRSAVFTDKTKYRRCSEKEKLHRELY